MSDTPQAFPSVNPAYDGNWDKLREFQGMTLRDYFAAAALMGICSNQYGYDLVYSDAAKHAYLHADAMLEERAKP